MITCSNTFLIHKCGAILGSNQKPLLNASRIFTACYWAVIITTVAIYSGNLLAFSTIKKIKLPFNSLEGLATHPTYQVMIPGGTATMDLFEVKMPCSLNENLL